MKQTRRILGILLALVMMLGSVSVGMSVFAADPETVLFGTYPQTQVTDETQIHNLYLVEKHWKSYNYYSGTGKIDDGKMTASDFMQYADFTYNGEAYRAVQFTKYRPVNTGEVARDSKISGAEYAAKLLYYFKYEPIEWIVLDKGNQILMSKKLLDAQPYQNVVSSSTTIRYASSSIRTFLNNDFYNVAFTDNQQRAIKDLQRSVAPYDSASKDTVTDPISLLTFDEAKKYSTVKSVNSDSGRVAKEYTDYAVCQGLSVYNEAADWWLLTPSEVAARACCVDKAGALSHNVTANMTNKGVRPVIKLPTLKEDTQSAIANCKHTAGKMTIAKVAATCTVAGHEEYVICKRCSAIVDGTVNKVIPATGHVDKVKRVGGEGSDGWCDLCGAELTIHLDNSGRLQLSSPIMKLLDMIRNLFLRIVKLSEDSKESDKKADELIASPEKLEEATNSTEAGKVVNSLADMLGKVIGTFKGLGENKNTEKNNNLTQILDTVKGVLNNTDE